MYQGEALNTDGISQTFDSHNSDCEEDGIVGTGNKSRGLYYPLIFTKLLIWEDIKAITNIF